MCVTQNCLTLIFADYRFQTRISYICTTHHSGGNKLYTGTAAPNGSQVGTTGDIYSQINAGGQLVQQWTKLSGTATNTGWG